MPLYSFECTCGASDDRFCSYEETKSQPCAECAQIMDKVLTGLKLVGPTSTKPAKIGGKTFETTSAVERYMATDGKGTKILSKNDREIVDKKYKLKHMREQRAQAAGFRSEKDRQADVRKRGRANGELNG